ncbi:hypothetical protein [Arthrobacter sp. Soil736]|uniref:hypothetical protein n=1 Tax=Arthrobacter sp. Soil736 TaxID=1736395 RepID=UPI0012F762ED|nr:hypothetical protein [Arthrobacter sp. Soil736]
MKNRHSSARGQAFTRSPDAEDLTVAANEPVAGGGVGQVRDGVGRVPDVCRERLG